MPDLFLIKKILIFIEIALMGVLGIAFFIYAWLFLQYNLGKISYEPLRKIRLVITIVFASLSVVVIIGYCMVKYGL